MSELSRVLAEIRGKLQRYQGKTINEQNTKTALIQPVLGALGWNVGNLEEVEQEYKRRPRDKPVDYALLVLRTPRLFVEAKALGQDLDDRKWASQIMGYATVAGVEWVVVTNGDQYRIYNACAAVPVEEKLFRTVAISDPGSASEETPSLLSKERISENDIEVLWKAHFVDRQVHAALQKLFAADPALSLVRLVKKELKELPSKEIRQSLRRMRAAFDFPIQPQTTPNVTAPNVKARRSAAAKKAWSTHRPSWSVSLRAIIQCGILAAPLKLTRDYHGHNLQAEVTSDGNVLFQGNTYESCSAAASAAGSAILGRPVNKNGWTFWRYLDRNGQSVELDAARQEFLKRGT